MGGKTGVNPENPCNCLTLHVSARTVPGGCASGLPTRFRPPAKEIWLPEDAARSGASRILVVDDEPHIRRVLSAILGNRGYDVLVASDGEEGFAIFETGTVDLVILDLMMPGANGLEILAKIRSHSTRPDIPVIILTAKGQDADREAALAGGVDDFLTKPFSPKKLIARIEEMLATGEP